MSNITNDFKVDMKHLQKVQRSLKKAAAIFPKEKELVDTLEKEIIKAQDDTSLNIYYSMSQYLKQRIKELRTHLEKPDEPMEEIYNDLGWSISYLEWLVTAQEDNK